MLTKDALYVLMSHTGENTGYSIPEYPKSHPVRTCQRYSDYTN